MSRDRRARIVAVAAAVSVVATASAWRGDRAAAGPVLASLTGAAPGTNELAPRWSPSGRYLSVERDDGTSRTIEIHAAATGGLRRVETLAVRPAPASGGFLLEAAGLEGPTFNAWPTWAPDERSIAFVSNGGAGVYDLWLGDVTPTGALAAPPTRVTDDAAADGQVAWSPVGDQLAFVSGRTDRGDLYVVDVATRRVSRLTRGGRSVLHPEWSPDGRRIAFAMGDGDNHDVCVIDVPTGLGMDGPAARAEAPAPSRGTVVSALYPAPRCLVVWPFDDVRPRWSPDGKRLAFYSSYNPDGDSGVWSLFTVAADGSEPTRGEGLLVRRLDTGVVVDLDVGPAWTPDGAGIVYVRRVDREFNPLYLATVATRATRRLDTGHAIHHDVAVARDGRLAVRAQVARWDRVLVGRLGDLLAGAPQGQPASEAKR